MREGPVTTIVISDVHVTTAEPPDPARPMWKRYKQADLFVDGRIARMLRDVRRSAPGRVELVLNGDFFDFDGVTQLPRDGRFPTTWLERHRGLAPTAAKSAWKMDRILDDHPELVAALREHVVDGHDLVVVPGNHDIDLLWPEVQERLLRRLDLDRGHTDPSVGERGAVRFCDWFYVSGGDTLIEHGNQYDSYCLCYDPIWPTIRLDDGPPRMRLPFGNHASRVMINGMGIINPHADATWIMPFWGFVLFFWQHVLRVQPLLPFTWMWTATVTFWLSVRDGLEPSERDVLRLEERVEEIAERARGTPRMVRGLLALRVHPAFFTPWRIARELWLDRLLLFALVVVGTFQVLATANVFVVVSIWWWLALLGLFFPPFLFYARSVNSEALDFDRAVGRRLHLVSAVAGVSRVVFGHTHREGHEVHGGVEVLNPGTWSPAFADPTCRVRVGRTCVVRIEPTEGGARVASARVWLDPGWETLPEVVDGQPSGSAPLVPPFRRPEIDGQVGQGANVAKM
ncbi:MAG TPA: metallophosphoesterase [Myxococcota bacterium]|nr:metallophosphoesterase [Myxococcota bacterium]